MVICLERGTHLHMAQLMPPPLTVSFFSKIQIGFTFLVLAHPGSPEQRAIKWVCVLFVCVRMHANKVKQCVTVVLTTIRITACKHMLRDTFQIT